jgi:diguanylate cyclase (GGDEF)-like protein
VSTGAALRRRPRLAALLLALLLPAATGAADPPSLARHGDVLVDHAATLDLQGALASLERGDFRPLGAAETRFGYTRARLWMHLHPPEDLANRSGFLVAIAPALLDEITLVHVREGDVLAETQLRLADPLAGRPRRERGFVLPVTGYDVVDDVLLLSIRTQGNLAVDGALLTESELLDWRRQADAEAASLYGALLALLAVNLLIFALTRVRSIAWLCLFVTATLGHYAISHGSLIPYLPTPGISLAHESYIACVFASGLAAIMFTRHALVLPRATPRLDRLIQGMAGLTFAGALAIPLLGIPNAYRLASALALLANPVLITAGILRWRQGDRSARTLTLAWSLLLAGVVLMILFRAGVLPKPVLTEDDTYLLSVASAVLLTFAMVQRLLLLQEEPRAVTPEVLRGLRASAADGDRMIEELEHSVRARNRELRSANERLELIRAETERHAHMLDALFASSAGMHRTEDVDELLQASLSQLAELFPHHGFGIVLQGERPGDVRYRHFVGVDDEEQGLIVDNAHLLGDGVRTTLRALLEDRAPPGASPASRQWQALQLGDGTTGPRGQLLARGRELPPRDLEVLRVFCTQIATALENRRLSAELAQLANTDPLTGVGNRTVFERALEQAVANASSRPRIDFCVLLADINGLKEVNDRHGHETGDALIRHAAEALRHCVRREDTLTRTGGDEFVVVCPGVGHALGRELSARIRTRLEVRPLDLPHLPEAITVSLSIGTASSEDVPPDQVVHTADMRMYDAKERHHASVSGAGAGR